MKLLRFLFGVFVAGYFLFLPLTLCAFQPEEGDIPITSNSDVAIKCFLDGREAYEMGRVFEADALFEKAVSKDPGFAMAWLYRAYATNRPEAEKFIQLAVKNSNKVSKGERILVDLAANATSPFAERLEKALKLVELYPESSRAHLLLASLYQEKHQYSKFRDQAVMAITVDPASPLGYRAYAASFLLNTPLDFDLAMKNMQKFLEMRPNEPTAWLALGDVYRINLELQEAKNAYNKAIELDPSSDIAFSKRGYINTYLGFFDEARFDFAKASKLAEYGTRLFQPNSNVLAFILPEGWANQAENIVSGVHKVPVNKIEKKSLEGESADHYFCCTVISMLHGIYVAPNQDLDETACLQKSLMKESISPGSMAEPNFAFIETLRAINSGDFELAKTKAEEHARMLNPEHPKQLQVYRYLRGMISYRQGNFTDAIDHYLKSDLNNNCVKFDLGLAYDKTGNFEEAHRLLSEVSQCRFTTETMPYTVRSSEKWMKSLAELNREE